MCTTTSPLEIFSRWCDPIPIYPSYGIIRGETPPIMEMDVRRERRETRGKTKRETRGKIDKRDKRENGQEGRQEERRQDGQEGRV